MSGIGRSNTLPPSLPHPRSKRKVQNPSDGVALEHVPKYGAQLILPRLSIVQEEVSLRRKAGKKALRQAACTAEQDPKEGRIRSASMPGKLLKRREKTIQPLSLAGRGSPLGTLLPFTHQQRLKTPSPPPAHTLITTVSEREFYPKRRHRRSRSLSELIQSSSSPFPLFQSTPIPLPTNQPWRSRDAWLALYGAPEPSPTVLHPSAMGTAAGWKGKGGSTFFGADRIRLKSTQERRGRYAKQLASEHLLVPSAPETPSFLTPPEPGMVQDKLHSSRGLRVPTSSSSSSSSSSYGTSPSSYSSSPTRVCYHARSLFGYDENDESLPPLLPNRSASSIPGPRPIPWGRSSPLPSPRVSPATPTTPTGRKQSSPLALLPSIPREWVHPSSSPSLRYVSSEYESREEREGAVPRAISSKRGGLLPIHAKGANEAEAGDLWTGQTKWEVNQEGKAENGDGVKREGVWKRLLPVSKKM